MMRHVNRTSSVPILPAATGPPVRESPYYIPGSYLKLADPLPGVKDVAPGCSDNFSEFSQLVGLEVRRLLRYTLLGYVHPLTAEVEKKAEADVAQSLSHIMGLLFEFTEKARQGAKEAGSAEAAEDSDQLSEKVAEMERQLGVTISESQRLHKALDTEKERATVANNKLRVMRASFLHDFEDQKTRFRSFLVQHVPDMSAKDFQKAMDSVQGVPKFNPNNFMDDGLAAEVKRQVDAAKEDIEAEKIKLEQKIADLHQSAEQMTQQLFKEQIRANTLQGQLDKLGKEGPKQASGAANDDAERQESHEAPDAGTSPSRRSVVTPTATAKAIDVQLREREQLESNMMVEIECLKDLVTKQTNWLNSLQGIRECDALKLMMDDVSKKVTEMTHIVPSHEKGLDEEAQARLNAKTLANDVSILRKAGGTQRAELEAVRAQLQEKSDEVTVLERKVDELKHVQDEMEELSTKNIEQEARISELEVELTTARAEASQTPARSSPSESSKAGVDGSSQTDPVKFDEGKDAAPAPSAVGVDKEVQVGNADDMEMTAMGSKRVARRRRAAGTKETTSSVTPEPSRLVSDVPDDLQPMEPMPEESSRRTSQAESEPLEPPEPRKPPPVMVSVEIQAAPESSRREGPHDLDATLESEAPAAPADDAAVRLQLPLTPPAEEEEGQAEEEEEEEAPRTSSPVPKMPRTSSPVAKSPRTPARTPARTPSEAQQPLSVPGTSAAPSVFGEALSLAGSFDPNAEYRPQVEMVDSACSPIPPEELGLGESGTSPNPGIQAAEPSDAGHQSDFSVTARSDLGSRGTEKMEPGRRGIKAQSIELEPEGDMAGKLSSKTSEAGQTAGSWRPKSQPISEKNEVDQQDVALSVAGSRVGTANAGSTAEEEPLSPPPASRQSRRNSLWPMPSEKPPMSAGRVEYSRQASEEACSSPTSPLSPWGGRRKQRRPSEVSMPPQPSVETMAVLSRAASPDGTSNKQLEAEIQRLQEENEMLSLDKEALEERLQELESSSANLQSHHEELEPRLKALVSEKAAVQRAYLASLFEEDRLLAENFFVQEEFRAASILSAALWRCQASWLARCSRELKRKKSGMQVPESLQTPQPDEDTLEAACREELEIKELSEAETPMALARRMQRRKTRVEFAVARRCREVLSIHKDKAHEIAEALAVFHNVREGTDLFGGPEAEEPIAGQRLSSDLKELLVDGGEGEEELEPESAKNRQELVDLAAETQRRVWERQSRRRNMLDLEDSSNSDLPETLREASNACDFFDRVEKSARSMDNTSLRAHHSQHQTLPVLYDFSSEEEQALEERLRLKQKKTSVSDVGDTGDDEDAREQEAHEATSSTRPASPGRGKPEKSPSKTERKVVVEDEDVQEPDNAPEKTPRSQSKRDESKRSGDQASSKTSSKASLRSSRAGTSKSSARQSQRARTATPVSPEATAEEASQSETGVESSTLLARKKPSKKREKPVQQAVVSHEEAKEEQELSPQEAEDERGESGDEGAQEAEKGAGGKESPARSLRPQTTSSHGSARERSKDDSVAEAGTDSVSLPQRATSRKNAVVAYKKDASKDKGEPVEPPAAPRQATPPEPPRAQDLPQPDAKLEAPAGAGQQGEAQAKPPSEEELRDRQWQELDQTRVSTPASAWSAMVSHAPSRQKAPSKLGAHREETLCARCRAALEQAKSGDHAEVKPQIAAVPRSTLPAVRWSAVSRAVHFGVSADAGPQEDPAEMASADAEAEDTEQVPEPEYQDGRVRGVGTAVADYFKDRKDGMSARVADTINALAKKNLESRDFAESALARRLASPASSDPQSASRPALVTDSATQTELAESTVRSARVKFEEPSVGAAKGLRRAPTSRKTLGANGEQGMLKKVLKETMQKVSFAKLMSSEALDDGEADVESDATPASHGVPLSMLMQPVVKTQKRRKKKSMNSVLRQATGHHLDEEEEHGDSGLVRRLARSSSMPECDGMQFEPEPGDERLKAEIAGNESSSEEEEKSPARASESPAVAQQSTPEGDREEASPAAADDDEAEGLRRQLREADLSASSARQLRSALAVLRQDDSDPAAVDGKEGEEEEVPRRPQNDVQEERHQTAKSVETEEVGVQVNFEPPSPKAEARQLTMVSSTRTSPEAESHAQEESRPSLVIETQAGKRQLPPSWQPIVQMVRQHATVDVGLQARPPASEVALQTVTPEPPAPPPEKAAGSKGRPEGAEASPKTEDGAMDFDWHLALVDVAGWLRSSLEKFLQADAAGTLHSFHLGPLHSAPQEALRSTFDDFCVFVAQWVQKEIALSAPATAPDSGYSPRRKPASAMGSPVMMQPASPTLGQPQVPMSLGRRLVHAPVSSPPSQRRVADASGGRQTATPVTGPTSQYVGAVSWSFAKAGAALPGLSDDFSDALEQQHQRAKAQHDLQIRRSTERIKAWSGKFKGERGSDGMPRHKELHAGVDLELSGFRSARARLSSEAQGSPISLPPLLSARTDPEQHASGPPVPKQRGGVTGSTQNI